MLNNKKNVNSYEVYFDSTTRTNKDEEVLKNKLKTGRYDHLLLRDTLDSFFLEIIKDSGIKHISYTANTQQKLECLNILAKIISENQLLSLNLKLTGIRYSKRENPIYSALEKNTSLEELSFSSSSWNDSELKIFQQMLMNNTNLKSLRFSYLSIDDINVLFSSIKKDLNITELEIKGEKTRLKSLNFLKHFPKLEYFTFTESEIDLHELLKVMNVKTHPNLKKIRSVFQLMTKEVDFTNSTVSHFVIEGNSRFPVSPLMIKCLVNCPNLKELYVSWESSDKKKDMVIYIKDLLIKSKKIEKITFYYNSLGENEISTLCEGLKVNKSLHTLNIVLNKIDKGIIELGTILKSNKNIESFKLDENLFLSLNTNNLKNEKYFNGFINEIQSNDYLKYISLTYIAIDSEGIKQLCSFISRNKSLKGLVLSMNLIDNEGYDLLCDTLCYNKNLTSLKIINQLNDAKVSNSLAKMIHCNQTLQDLDIKIKELENQDMVSIFEAISKNKSLKRFIVLNDHMIGNETLSELLFYNYTLTHLSFKNRYMPFFEIIERNKDFIVNYYNLYDIKAKDISFSIV